MRVISCVNPLITAKPYPAVSGIDYWRVMPWEALCCAKFAAQYGPVTTDPFGVRLRSCHIVDVASMIRQIYGLGNTRALFGKAGRLSAYVP
jgi:hypothetical protein